MKPTWSIYTAAFLLFLSGMSAIALSLPFGIDLLTVFSSLILFYLGVQLLRIRAHARLIAIFLFALIFLWNAFLLTVAITSGRASISSSAVQLWGGRSLVSLMILASLMIPPVPKLFRERRLRGDVEPAGGGNSAPPLQY